MKYRSILVHYDKSKESKGTLEAVANMAFDNDVHVTGLYVIPHINTPIYAEATVPASILEGLEQAGKDSADSAEEVFNEVMGRSNCSSEWVVEKGYTDEIVNRFALSADLVVIGQTNESMGAGLSRSVESRILLGSARPVMVIPDSGIKKPIGKRIMVCWNGKNESARAIYDAMPLLSDASLVDVVAVVKDADTDVSSVEIARNLVRHGAPVEMTNLEKGRKSTSEVLLAHAARRNFDLIVMGAYGHNRFREMVLGGVTFNILRNMEVPVLMSH